MKKVILNHLVIAALVVLAAFSGCNRDKPENDQPGNLAVKLKADLQQASLLKVANDKWEATDRVGLYMKRVGQALTASDAVYSYANNVQMSIDPGNDLVSTPPVMYPQTGNVDFIAYYPYNENVGAEFTIPVDVAGHHVAGLPTEVLYSNNITSQAPTNAVVRLDFLYSLAKIELTVTGGTNSKLTAADFAAMTATVEGLYTQAMLYLADGAFTNHSEKQSITLYRKNSNNSSVTFEMLALPTVAEVIFKFNVGGEVYEHEMTVDYAGAKLYRYAFALDYPPTPEPKATLLNTYIIPRDEEPMQNITITVPEPLSFEPEMVFVEGGTFMMGSPEGVGRTDERPQHEVTLSSFSIGKYPVTQAQWETIMGMSLRQHWERLLTYDNLFGEGDDYPMYYVAWNHIAGTYSPTASSMEINGIIYYEDGYIYKLNKLTGKNYRLPTEAEWEYAARGGNKSQGYVYSGSNNIADVAWYNTNSGGSTQPVGTKAPNELDIYDMSGNVFEWCNDRYGDYTATAKENPIGPTSGSSRVLRGGSWNYSASTCRVAYRDSRIPREGDFFIGFRLVLVP